MSNAAKSTDLTVANTILAQLGGGRRLSAMATARPVAAGRYSHCQMYGDRCFGCAGAGAKPARLTAKVLDAARAKVEAGELTALRAKAKARRDAKAEIAPLAARARELYAPIGKAYDDALNAKDALNKAVLAMVIDGDAYAAVKDALGKAFWTSKAWRAQTMANAIYWGSTGSGRKLAGYGVVELVDQVSRGKRTNTVAVLVELHELVAMLETLTGCCK